MNLVFLIALGLGSVAYAQERPVLRLEAGMHLTTIRQIGLDAAGRYLVTASQDKTARLWEIATGRQLMVLRPPLGAGNEGRLDAVAISPDGAWVATGGWTGYQWDNSFSIYLFDRASGQMVKRLRGLPDVITRLAVSPDGQRLAAVLSQGGLRVFQMKDGTLIGQDNINEGCFGVDFDRRGRLVTSCYNGQVRLYDGNTKCLTQIAAPSGKHPFTVRFSSNGEQVAVGYTDTAAVDVLAGEDLKLLYHPDITGVDRGSLHSVAWSANGHQLCAAGHWDVARRYSIRCWSQAGKGPYRDTPATLNSMSDLAARPSGGMAFSAADPAWGTVGADGKLGALHSGPLADFSGNGRQFLLDRKGQVVQFGYKQWGQQPASFSLETRALSLGAKGADLLPPRLQAPGLEIIGWRTTAAVTVNGSPLLLNKNEVARSLAIASNGESFLLGSEWRLRHFTAQGKLLWEKPSPGVAWSVNLSEDGRLAVAAFGDGTIRWYNIKDGTELLAFFPHADKKRWVLWTPSGYYDASVGGEELIGWHVNRGPDKAADFFPASHFRTAYYRPDIISQALSREAPEAPPNLPLLLPPVVSIRKPEADTNLKVPQVSLHLSLRSPSGEPITLVKALINGRPALEFDPDGEERLLINLPVPPADSLISVLAQTRHSAGEPASVRLHWTGERPAPTLDRGKLYLLALGVDYPPGKDHLSFPVADAQAVTKELLKQKGKLYEDVIPVLLPEREATRNNIIDEMEKLRKAGPRDMVMVFLAGHGLVDPNDLHYYYMPHDGVSGKYRQTMLSGQDLLEILRPIKAKVVLFLDTCEAAAAMATRSPDSGAGLRRLINELASTNNGLVVFAASEKNQSAQEDPQWGHGAFSLALVEALSGQGNRVPALDDESGKKLQEIRRGHKLTTALLDEYLYLRVRALTQRQQVPVSGKQDQTIPIFPLAYVAE